MTLNYVLSFEPDGDSHKRIETRQENVKNIHEAIRKVKQEHPNAGMFRVIEKRWVNA